MDESEVTYQKIRRILNCPEMIKAHAFLYALDQENVDESNREKIDRLYELGKARGVIQEDTPEEDAPVDECGDDDDTQIFGGPDDALTGQEMTPGNLEPAKVSSAFTVLYSAMKDGQVKTGEYFSSATDSEAAKQDCIASLSQLGYSCIRVLGIEQANDAVDMGQSLDEDDSKEYEDQETGAGDTGDSKKADDNASEEKDVDGGDDRTDAEEKPEPAPEKDEKKDEPKDAEGDSEEKPEEDAEKTDVEKADTKPQDDGGKKKLSATDKQVLRDEYVGIFKAELQRTKLEKSVEDMTVKEKADFWGTIAKKWTKADPEEFLSDREIEKLNNTVIRNG